jgi:hypothetical protein
VRQPKKQVPKIVLLAKVFEAEREKTQIKVCLVCVVKHKLLVDGRGGEKMESRVVEVKVKKLGVSRACYRKRCCGEEERVPFKNKMAKDVQGEQKTT